MYTCLLFVLASAPFVLGQAPIQIEPVSELCLGCICEAISNCNRSLECYGDVCGMFKITWPYWADANKPTLAHDNVNDVGAYSRCVIDPVCAAKTVMGYMERYAQDCNNDGVVNCWDYAAIHHLGGYGCRGQLKQEYYTKFANCQHWVQSQLSQSGGAVNSNDQTHLFA